MSAHRPVWVLVCDASKARIFEVRAPDPSWHDVLVLHHDASRSKARDLVTDHSGRRSPEGGSVHHNALAPSSSPKEVEKEHFAHLVGKTLDEAMRAARFGRWVLIAPPHFAGLVKKELTLELEKHLMSTVDKNASDASARELAETFGETVRIPVDQQDVVRETVRHTH